MHRIYHAGSREQGLRIDLDLVRAISERARDTRKPGQTLQARFDEIMGEAAANG